MQKQNNPETLQKVSQAMASIFGDDFTIEPVKDSGFVVATLPILDCSNDKVQIYVEETKPSEYRVTDDGEMFGGLVFSGFVLSEKEKKTCISMLERNQISLSCNHDTMKLSASCNDESLEATIRNFAQTISGIVALCEQRNEEKDCERTPAM